MKSIILTNYRVFLLKLLIISLSFESVTVFIPSLWLPIFIFFIYLSVSIFFSKSIFTLTNTLQPVMLISFLFAIIVVVSLLNITPYTGAGFSFISIFPILVLFFHFLSKEIINESLSVDEIMNFFIIGAAFLALLYLLKIGVSVRPDNRLEILETNPNSSANYSNVAIMFIVYLLNKGENKRIHFIYYLLIPLLLYINYSSASRGGLIGLIIGIIVFFYFNSKNNIKRFNYIMLGGLIVFLITLLFLSNEFLYGRFFQEEASLTDSRLPMWKEAYSIVKDNLLFGVGMFVYQRDIIWIRGEYFGTHNEFLSILIYSGIIGLLAFLLFIWKCIVAAYKTYLNYENPIFLSILSIVIFNLLKGGGTLLNTFTWFVLALTFSSQYLTFEIDDKEYI